MHVHLPDLGDRTGYGGGGVDAVSRQWSHKGSAVCGGSQTISGCGTRLASGELLRPAIITAGPGLDGASVISPIDGEAAVREQQARL